MNKRIIHTVFEREADRVPDRIAVEESHRHISYRELNGCANRLAHLLRALGVEKASIVATMLPSGIELVAALLATFKSGGIYLPLDVAFSRKRLSQVFNQCAPRVLVTSQNQFSAVEAMINELALSIDYVIVLEEAYQFSVVASANNHQHAINGNDPAFSTENPDMINEPQDGNYLFYTSGSTGEAKAILGCHDSLSHFIHWQIKEFGVTQEDRTSQLIQVTFDASFRDILVPLCVGGTVCIPPAEVRANMLKLVEWLETAKVTLLHCVPSLFRLIIKELAASPSPKLRLGELKHVLMAGEALYAKDIHYWRKTVGHHVELVNLYGPTETTMIKTCHRIKEIPEEASQSIPVGHPISNTAILILNSQVPCAIGEIGEVYIMTPFMTKGYFNQPELTNRVFIQNPLVTDKVNIIYKTGDLGRYLKDRSVEIVGRTDDQVKINGIRIELNEIKQALLGVGAIREAEVVVHKNHDGQNELICYYTGTPLDVEEIIRHLKKDLNENTIPAYYVHLKEFPLSLNGKVDKKALPKPENVLIRNEDYEAPVGLQEEVLEKIYQEVLGLSRVGRKISFFRVGGNSLKAMQTVSRIYKELNVSLVLADLFTHPTIKQLALVTTRAQEQSYQAIEPVSVQDYYDVSLNQKRLWIMYQFQEAQTAFNIPAAYLLEGALQVETFQQAFQTLAQRHESLRTTFVKVAGEPKQKIHSAPGFTVEYLDLRSNPDREAKALAMADAAANVVFNLERGPLVFARIVQLSQDRFVFLLTMHHIISDGWSMEVLVAEILELYNACRQGRTHALAPLRVHYKDYTAWQHRQLSHEKLKEHQQYWLNQLEGELPVLELPTDFPRPAIQRFRGKTRRFSIPSELSSALKERFRQEEVTLFMGLLASVQVLLYRRTGQQDLIIGTPVAGRPHPDLENQIGFYVNMLALRTRFQPAMSFRELLTEVKQTVLDGFTHGGYPFIQLVEDLKLAVDLSRSNLFDVVVQIQDAELQGLKEHHLQEVRVKGLRADFEGSKYDLTFNILDTGTEIVAEIEYNTDLFRESTIEQLQSEWITLLGWISESASHSVAVLKKELIAKSQETPLLSTEKKPVLTKKFAPVHYRFEGQAARVPDAIAVESKDQSWSYQALNEKANQLAHLLRDLGIKAENPVGVLIPSSPELVISLLGVFKAGGIYLPIDTAFARKRLLQLFHECAPNVLITNLAQLPAVRGVLEELAVTPKYLVLLEEGKTTVWQDNSWEAPEVNTNSYSIENPAPVSVAEDGNYIIYTSGSTGEAKAILGSHGGLSHFIDWEIRELGIDKRHRVSQLSQFTFDASLRDIWLPLCTGSTLCIPSPAIKGNPAQLLEWLESSAITLVHCVPSLFKLLTKELLLGKEKAGGLPELQYVLMAGEPLYAREILNWRQAVGTHTEIVNLYGTSETTLAKTFYRIGDLPDGATQVLHVGKPISDTTVIITAGDTPCVAGEIGEIYIQTPYRSKGYYKNLPLTQAVFVRNPLAGSPEETVHKTGDYGRYLKDGSIEVLGRTDEQVKINGIRVELNEVKQALLSIMKVREAEVVVHKNNEGDNELIAYYTGTLPEAAVRRHLKTELNDHMMPSYCVQLKEFPLTLNGKIDKKALPKPENILIKDADYEAPLGELEFRLEEIWKKVLGLGRIGRKVSFFRIGGNSLKAMQVTSRLYQEFGVSVLLADLFTHPTIGQLSAIVSQAAQIAYDEIVPVPTQEHYELTHAQRRLWVMEQFEEEGMVLIMPSAYVFGGKLNREALDRAMHALVQRHESLRTNIVTVQGKPMQRVRCCAAREFHVSYADLRNIEERESLALTIAAEETNTRFDLEKGPLVRAKLIQLETEKYVFLFSLHHIISDGWSLKVFVDELMVLYQAFAKRKENPLPPLGLQYKDYAAWQNKQLKSEKHQAARRYWLNLFEGELPMLELPLDFLRPATQTFNGDKLIFTIDPELTLALRKWCLQQDVTLFMVLLASVDVLLYRYSGQTDITVGFPIAGRSRKEFENQIGLYINTLALRNRFEHTDSLEAVLLQVKQTTLDAYQHAHYPLDLLIDELNINRLANRSPLFDVAIQLQHNDRDDDQIPSHSFFVEALELKSERSKHELLFNLTELDDTLVLSLEYNTDLFSRDTIELMGEDYLSLVQAQVETPLAGISDAQLLPSRNEEEHDSFLRQIDKF